MTQPLTGITHQSQNYAQEPPTRPYLVQSTGVETTLNANLTKASLKGANLHGITPNKVTT